MGSAASRASTKAFLYAHGIEASPEALDSMMKEAVQRLQRTLYRPDSRADLTSAEAKALERGGFVLYASESSQDPLAQTVAEFAALLQSSLSTSGVAARLGVDSSRVRQRLLSRPPSLLGIRIGNGWYVPEFQFDGDRLLPGIGEVVARLDPELHLVAVYRWFTTPNPDLSADELSGRALSPRDWLRAGLPIRPVSDLAANL